MVEYNSLRVFMPSLRGVSKFFSDYAVIARSFKILQRRSNLIKDGGFKGLLRRARNDECGGQCWATQ